MTHPKVSVIIPTYNRAGFLPRAIKSVLNQIFQDFEIIVVDDGSTDNTEQVVRNFQNRDKRIKYIWQEQSGGPSKPKNTGIKAARGRYIAFLDSDDEWFPEKLEKQLELFEKGPSNLGFVGCNLLSIEQKTGKILEEVKLPSSLRHNALEKFLVGCFIYSSSDVVVKSKILANVGLFDENIRIGEDWDMSIRISQKYKFDFVSKPLFKHYIHRGNITKTTSIDEKIKDQKYILRKYKNLYKKYPEAYSTPLRRIGRMYLLSSREEKARVYLKKSIKYNIFNFKSYLYLLSSFRSSSFCRNLLKQKRKLFR